MRCRRCWKDDDTTKAQRHQEDSDTTKKPRHKRTNPKRSSLPLLGVLVVTFYPAFDGGGGVAVGVGAAGPPEQVFRGSGQYTM
jgi:hypothetical protein